MQDELDIRRLDPAGRETALARLPGRKQTAIHERTNELRNYTR